MNGNACPHCGYILESRPKRKKKCPNCEQYIVVRKGNLLTEEKAAIQDWLGRVEHFGISERTFEQNRRALAKQFGSEPPINDVKWRILNAEVIRRRDLQERKLLYLEMAHIAREERKDPNPYVTETARCELLDLKESGVISRVRINTCNDSFVCPACREASTRTYGLDEALKTMPIPNLCQSENGCRCWYTAVVDIDEIADRIARRWGRG